MRRSALVNLANSGFVGGGFMGVSYRTMQVRENRP